MKAWELFKRILRLIIVLPLMPILFVLIFITVFLFLVMSLTAKGQIKTGQIVYLLHLGAERFAEEIKLIDAEGKETR